MPTARFINRRSLIKHLGVSGGLLAASCGSRFWAFAQNPGPRTFGIDVSVWGGEIDWHRVVERSIHDSCLCRPITWVRTKRPPMQILGLRIIGKPYSGWGCYTAHISVVIQMRTQRP